MTMEKIIRDQLDLSRKLLSTVNTKEEFMLIAEDIRNLESLESINCSHINSKFIKLENNKEFEVFLCLDCGNILFIKEACNDN